MKNELNIRCIMSKDTLPVTGGEQHTFTRFFSAQTSF